MSAQINLYHPRYLRRRELLTLGNVMLAAAAVYLLLAAAGGWAWQNAATRSQAATAAEVQLKAVKGQVDAATNAASVRKPSPQLIGELERAEGMLRRRGDIARLLESGAVGNTGGFADYLRGFARQVPEGLWLTGFSINSGGSDMEIRGSMLDAALLPEYIRRLGNEKAFQGRSFASLTMNRAEPSASPRAAAPGAAAVAPAPTSGPRPIDFVLMPKLAESMGAGQ
ncbi:MAG: PilN domain-containing protein [Rhodocyclales bacterium]|nr:PilN domain-containing protein [Rhodocyclales bacterium]